jgi:hypothetical protein
MYDQEDDVLAMVFWGSLLNDTNTDVDIDTDSIYLFNRVDQ